MSDDETANDILQDCRLVQFLLDLIEKWLRLYMTPSELVYTVSSSAKVDPELVRGVWQYLTGNNKEFIRAYYKRLILKDQIDQFNLLLQRQFELMECSTSTDESHSDLRPAGPQDNLHNRSHSCSLQELSGAKCYSPIVKCYSDVPFAAAHLVVETQQRNASFQELRLQPSFGQEVQVQLNAAGNRSSRQDLWVQPNAVTSSRQELRMHYSDVPFAPHLWVVAEPAQRQVREGGDLGTTNMSGHQQFLNTGTGGGGTTRMLEGTDCGKPLADNLAMASEIKGGIKELDAYTNDFQVIYDGNNTYSEPRNGQAPVLCNGHSEPRNGLCNGHSEPLNGQTPVALCNGHSEPRNGPAPVALCNGHEDMNSYMF